MPKHPLSDISTRAPKEFNKEDTKQELVQLREELGELQNLLYAAHQKSILVVIQGMDASGKDGLVKDVFTSMNPQGVQVSSFKAPTEEELDHDFLWRIHKQVPGKGMIKIFNRSHYEDILITRVNGWVDDPTAKARMKAINDFEELITTHGHTVLLKFYLHISKEEQRQRLEERMTQPEKMWKYNAQDFKVAEQWDAYMQMYEEAFEHCSKVPWHIVPADQNWYKSYTVAKVLRDAIKGLGLKYPGLKS